MDNDSLGGFEFYTDEQGKAYYKPMGADSGIPFSSGIDLESGYIFSQSQSISGGTTGNAHTQHFSFTFDESKYIFLTTQNGGNGTKSFYIDIDKQIGTKIDEVPEVYPVNNLTIDNDFKNTLVVTSTSLSLDFSGKYYGGKVFVLTY